MSSDDDEHVEREKWRTYPDTVLHFEGDTPFTVDLRRPVDDGVRRALAAIGLDVPFAILTAENPDGRNPEDAASTREAGERRRENAQRSTALEDALDDAGVVHAAVDGSAPDGSYRERCVAVRLGREAAMSLAGRLGQLALFWYDGRRFWLLPAEADQPPAPLPAN